MDGVGSGEDEVIRAWSLLENVLLARGNFWVCIKRLKCHSGGLS